MLMPFSRRHPEAPTRPHLLRRRALRLTVGLVPNFDRLLHLSFYLVNTVFRVLAQCRSGRYRPSKVSVAPSITESRVLGPDQGANRSPRAAPTPSPRANADTDSVHLILLLIVSSVRLYYQSIRTHLNRTHLNPCFSSEEIEEETQNRDSSPETKPCRRKLCDGPAGLFSHQLKIRPWMRYPRRQCSLERLWLA